MKLISRSEAEAQGLKRYYTGKRCKRGHLSERYVSNRKCAECTHIRNTSEAQKWYVKQYYKENTEYYKQWHKENAEARKQYNKQYRKENAETIKQYQKQYKKQWRRNNPDKINAYAAKRRANKQEATPAWLTTEDYKWIHGVYSLAKKFEEVTGEPYHVDHIYPLTSSEGCGLHVPQNLQILKAEANLSKHNSWCYNDLEPLFMEE